MLAHPVLTLIAETTLTHTPETGKRIGRKFNFHLPCRAYMAIMAHRNTHTYRFNSFLTLTSMDTHLTLFAQSQPNKNDFFVELFPYSLSWLALAITLLHVAVEPCYSHAGQFEK